MLDWKIYPNSRIEKLPLPLRGIALLARNLWNLLFRWGSDKPSVSDRHIFDVLEMAVDYVMGSRVEGDIAEFGSHGRTSRVLCQALKRHQSKRPIHLFDSFEGFPHVTSEEDLQSPHVANQIWPEGGSAPPITANQLRHEMERYLPAEQICIYEGWFNQTLPNVTAGTSFALVHIDCDLYESTYQVLSYLFENTMIAEGCIVLFDDWNCNLASPQFGERKAWSDAVTAFGIEYSDAGSYGWGGHKFHVHCYRSIPSRSAGFSSD